MRISPARVGLGAHRPRFVSLFAVACFGGVAAFAPDAQAITAWTTDCASITDKNSYNPGDGVCVTGELDVIPPGEFVCAAGYVSVVPFNSANPWADVTMGGANYILGCAGAGAFYDEYVWLPRLKPGSYEITIDQHPWQFENGGAFGTEDYRTGMSFTVTNAPIVFSVDVAAIKAAAEDGLAFAAGIRNLVLALSIIDTLSTAADWTQAFGLLGGGAAILLGVYCYKTNLEDQVLPCATSYNSAVIAIGNRILQGIAQAQEKHYGSLIADPPDPDYESIVPLELGDAIALGGPFTPLADQEGPRRQIAVAQLAAIQAASYQALVPTLEKLQGAQNDGSNLGMLLQSEKTIAYVDVAMAAGERMLEELDGLETYLTAEGVLDASFDLAGAVAAIEQNGVDEQSRNLMRSFGIADADIDQAEADLLALEVPAEVSWAEAIVQARGTYEAMKPALVDLAAQAEAVRAENEPYALRLGPKASAAGPDTGSVGVPSSLSASAEHIDPSAALDYAWDTDLDGDFDDGTGADLDYVPPAPGRTVIAVQVTDPDGRADVAYHSIEVAISNAPPEIVGFAPADPAPFAKVGDKVAFHVDVSDADGDPISYSWQVDGAEQGTAADFELTMPDEQPHEVVVVVADDDPYSPDAEAHYTVRSAKWEGQTGEGGSGGASSSGAGGDGAANADDSGGGCACAVAGLGERDRAGLTLAIAAAALVLGRRARRRSSGPSTG